MLNAGCRCEVAASPRVVRRAWRWPRPAPIAFSGKAIIVKLAYRHGVDAVTLIMYRMLFALPLFVLLAWWAGRGKPALTRRDWIIVVGLGFSGYYLASFLDFAGLQYISAGLERLILYLNPTLVLALGVLLFKQQGHARAAAGAGGQLRRRAAGLRPRDQLRRQRTRCSARRWSSAVRSATRVYLVYSGQRGASAWAPCG